MDIIKDYIIFDDIDSRDYGIEIFFQDIDRTPKRVYSKIEVPGRNGAVIIDEGRYEDVPVIYGCVALNDADRSAFVNALASKTNYFRLRDSFNPSEFYSAVFEGDVDPRLTPERDRSVFSISFTRKPERWLTDGEEHISVTSGQLIENPTLFESKPMLEVEGYGTIGFNGFEIELENTELGDIVLSSSPIIFDSNLITFDKNKVNNGDRLYFSEGTVSYNIRFKGVTTGSTIQITTDSVTDAEARIYQQGSANPSVGIFPDTSNGFVEGVASSINPEWSGTVTITPPNETAEIYTVTATISIQFDGVQSVRFVGATINGIPDTDAQISKGYNSGTVTLSAISTVGALGDPTYVDCDLGEVYMIKDGSYISLNRYVDLGSELPTLASGSNEITFDNTIRDLKIVPRWWQV